MRTAFWFQVGPMHTCTDARACCCTQQQHRVELISAARALQKQSSKAPVRASIEAALGDSMHESELANDQKLHSDLELKPLFTMRGHKLAVSAVKYCFA